MRNIKINRLVLENFKCHKNLVLTFNGQNASIYGDNATGKTSIYDALTWLLFGKDSRGNGEKNIDIKPLNAAGEVEDHDAITSVTAELDVDGVPVTLCRNQREVWQTKRGSAEAYYTGNESSYFVDGVPMKKNLYDGRIKDMIPEETFRSLTSVSYFANDLKWQSRRGILFDMAGTLTDREIMEKDSRFAPLLQAMGNRDLQDYKAAISYERKGLMGTRDEIPARISETQRMLEDASGIDLPGAEAAAESLWETISQYNANISALDNGTDADRLRLEMQAYQSDLQALESQNRLYRKGQDDSSGKIRHLNLAIKYEIDFMTQTAAAKTRAVAQKDSLSAEHKRMQDEWVEVNGTAFTGGTCPTCGQPLPFALLQEKTQHFEQQKQAQLERIAQKGKGLADLIRDCSAAITDADEKIKSSDQRVKDLTAQLEEVQAGAEPKVDMEGYAEKKLEYESRLSQLKERLSAVVAGDRDMRNRMIAEQQEATERLKEVQALIAQAQSKAKLEARIAELKDHAKATSEKMEGIEQMLYLIEEFTRYKAGFVESSVNDMFRIATFRLFREQANGGLEERCDVVHDGVPYTGLNNGMRINVGVDIINALSRFYGVSVPLFIDNAEGVTNLEPCTAQTIRLVVSESDKELRIV